MDPISLEFSRAIKQAREDAKISQAELARRIGVSQQAISAIEAGTSGCSLSTAMGLAAALEIGALDAYRRISQCRKAVVSDDNIHAPPISEEEWMAELEKELESYQLGEVVMPKDLWMAAYRRLMRK